MKEKFKAFFEKHAEIWRLIKFTFTGASTSILYYIVYFVCDMWIFNSLNHESMNVLLKNAPLLLSFCEKSDIKFLGTAIAYLLASVISYIASYIMNRKMTFKSNSNIAVSTILFAIMVIVTTIFTVWFGSFLKSWLTSPSVGCSETGIVVVGLVPIVAMLVPFIWTYPFQKYVIYRNKKTDEDKTEPIEEEAEEQEKTE